MNIRKKGHDAKTVGFKEFKLDPRWGKLALEIKAGTSVFN